LKVQVHKRKGHIKLDCGLTKQGKNGDVIQHTRTCLSLYWAAWCFYFVNQPCALYSSRLVCCFYICEVVVAKCCTLYTFLTLKEQFTLVSKVHALRTTIKLGFWGSLGVCMGSVT